MMSIIEQLIKKFQHSAAGSNTTMFELLHREAFYFLVNGLYKQIKNNIEFDSWYTSILRKELLTQTDAKLHMLRI